MAAWTWAMTSAKHLSRPRLSLRTAGPIHSARTRPTPRSPTAPTTTATIASCLAWKAVPRRWLKLAVLGGPDIRSWAPGTPAGFDRNRQVYWADVLGDRDAGQKRRRDTACIRRFEQPAFSSSEHLPGHHYSATWKHKFNDHWAASAGFQLYIGDWQQPVNRDDWIYTPSAGLAYTYNQHLSAELT